MHSNSAKANSLFAVEIVCKFNLLMFFDISNMTASKWATIQDNFVIGHDVVSHPALPRTASIVVLPSRSPNTKHAVATRLPPDDDEWVHVRATSLPESRWLITHIFHKRHLRSIIMTIIGSHVHVVGLCVCNSGSIHQWSGCKRFINCNWSLLRSSFLSDRTRTRRQAMVRHLKWVLFELSSTNVITLFFNLQHELTRIKNMKRACVNELDKS